MRLQRSECKPVPAMNEKATADLLGCSPSALRSWRRKKIGPVFCKFGRLVRYLPEDITRWIESQKSGEEGTK